MSNITETIPSVIVRSEEHIKVINDKEKWTTENIEILKRIMFETLQENKEEIEIRYNFTHLSNILKISKQDIYNKMIELYNNNKGEIKDNQESHPKNNEDIEYSIDNASVDSVINVNDASKLLYNRHILHDQQQQDSGNNSLVSNKTNSELVESVEDSLLEREIMENC